MIQLIAVSNPFQPVSSRVEHSIVWREGITLAEVLEVAGVPVLRHSCVIDGLVIPEEILAGYLVPDGTVVISMPTVAGGSWGKMAAEIGVMVAAAAATFFTAGIAAPMFAMTAAQFSSAVGAAVALGGNILINAFMNGGSGKGNDSASWDPTGPKTVASGGTPIPKGYGTVRSGGNIIASYVSAEGVDNYLNVLVSYGWGPARDISDIRINNNSIWNFQDAVYQVRYGSNDQTPIPYFNNVVNGFPQAVRCVAGTPEVIQGTGTQTQGIEVVMQFPQGLYYSNDDGSLRSLTVSYKVEYAISGTNDWQTLIVPRTTTDVPRFNNDGTMSYPGWVVIPNDTKFSSGIVYDYDNNLSPTAHVPGDPWSGTQTVNYYNADGSTYTGPIFLQGEWQPYDVNLAQEVVVDWGAGYEIFGDANQGTLYHTTSIFNLPPNKYDIRVTKYGSAFSGDPLKPGEFDNSRTGEQVWIHSINEIQYEDLAYPNMILVGVRALATGQLSGGNLTISALIDYGIGVPFPAELAAFSEDNPALVAYDMLVDTLYGGGVPPSNIDLSAFAAWAAVNDELVSDGFTGTIKRHVFNGVFDQDGTNLWKSLQKVAMVSNASMVQIGRNYSVVVDAPVTVPAQIFNVGNIIRDTIQDTWVSLDDRSNRVELTFPDAARDYRTDEPCAVMLPSDIADGVAVKTTRVELLGCTSRAQAWHWGFRKLSSTDALLLSRSFDVGIAAIACQVGSVIGVQDDVTGWAEGGRIQDGSTTASLVIDRDDLTFTSGEGWTVSVLHPVIERGTAVISDVIGNVLTLAVSLPAGRILQAVSAAGVEVGVRGYAANTITLESAVGFTIGQTIKLYDHDVIDTQPVASIDGFALVPLNPFIQAPTADCPWVYGQSAGAFPAKLFTVTNIRRKSDEIVTIDTIQYDASIYSDDTPLITETLGTPDVNAGVLNLHATEQYALANGANGGQASNISVGWQNGPNTVATQIWVAQNDANQPLSKETLVATVPKATTCTLVYPTGTILEIRAVGIDANGNTAPFTTAPVITITVQGSDLAPGDVPLFAGITAAGSTTFTWSAATNGVNYEIRYNADIANSNWQTALLLYSGNALTWTDGIPRQGCYLIKALSADSVESVNAASWNYLQSPTRLNMVGLMPGQTILVALTRNTYDASTGKASIAVTCQAQALYRGDGTIVLLPETSVSWLGTLAPDTEYYLYFYLAPSTFALTASTGGNPLPDTAPNTDDAAFCSANGNYAAAAMTATTPDASHGGTGTVASFQVEWSPVTSGGVVHFNVTSVVLLGGGDGYTAPTATLTGNVYSGSSVLPETNDLTLTFVPGGSITSVSGWDSAIPWVSPPHVIVAD